MAAPVKITLLSSLLTLNQDLNLTHQVNSEDDEKMTERRQFDIDPL